MLQSVPKILNLLSRQLIKSLERNFTFSSRVTGSDFDNLIKDHHYEKVKSQYFGPILLKNSKNSDGAIKSSFDYCKRPDLIYNGIPYHDLSVARILARWNNTIITIRNSTNNVFCKVSCRSAGFFHAKKKTLLAGEVTGELAARKALGRGCTEHVKVVLKGIGPGRKTAIDGLVQGGLKVVSISDITPITNDGCPQRPRKIRRI